MCKERIGGGWGKNIWLTHTPSTLDNYFTGDQIISWIGGNGFVYTMACRRYPLPGGIEVQYLHKEKSSNKTNVAQFFNPVVATKNK